MQKCSNCGMEITNDLHRLCPLCGLPLSSAIYDKSSTYDEEEILKNKVKNTVKKTAVSIEEPLKNGVKKTVSFIKTVIILCLILIGAIVITTLVTQ